MKEVSLPSGAKLKIGLPDFADAKHLYQVLAEEIKSIKMEADRDIDTNFFKDMFCAGLSSKKLDAAIAACMKKSLYCASGDDIGVKIEENLFRNEKPREDYLIICFEVCKESVAPFMKTLMQLFSQATALIQKDQA